MPRALIPNPDAADGQAVAGGVALHTVEFTSLAAQAAGNAAIPHNLGRKPIIISSMLECISVDDATGMTPGQQVELVSLFDQYLTETAAVIGCDDINIYCSIPDIAGGLTGGNLWWNWGGVNVGPSDQINFLVRPNVKKSVSGKLTTGNPGSRPFIGNFKIVVTYI
jgi:hypothetical protein